MGYGRQALEYLQSYYEGKIANIDEVVPESAIPVVEPEVCA